MKAYAIKFLETGNWVEARSGFPGQTSLLTLDCLFARGADASFARVSLAESYECKIKDFEVVEIELEPTVTNRTYSRGKVS
jgi:hypothetical protein